MKNFTPQRLGDGGGTSSLNDGSALTPDEIRRRRIEALDRIDSVNYRPQPAIQQPVTSSTAITNIDRDNVPDDEVDEELQAALALSLQDETTSKTTTTTTTTTTISTTEKFDISTIYTTTNVPFGNNNRQLEQVPQSKTWKSSDRSNCKMELSSVSVQEYYQKILHTISSQPLQNIFTYHRILWDDHLTTDSDKNRWISQGIDVRSCSSSNSCNNDQESFQNEPVVVTNPDGVELLDSTSIMDVITSSHLPWGLVQQHGGPCGVLAAIQAELLRSLLFTNNNSSGEILSSGGTETEQNNKKSKLPIRNALARAIAIVLCRAALTPSSIGNDSSKLHNKNESSGFVRIVLPSYVENRALTWQDLEPWYSTENVNERSGSLTIYNIPITGGLDTAERHPPNTLLSSTITEQMESNMMTSKRQKVVSNDTELSSSREVSSLNVRIDRMACIIEQFLLDESHCSKSVSTMETFTPLDCFRRPGGVLLLVLSLIASRTIETICDDFDDPVDTRLTGQFGHCSQELINLLLTGRAVSNVFDNTLSPSGDMICRGIQSRPVIGYLTQLEAMRYCEVGGYYKMPLFPIWVVGSTSHFTVLFGDPVALKESKSDILLDECRRAFKTVEGGEENGFIQTDQLTSVLKNLNIDVGGTNVDDKTARIQTLAAALEVSGAGIILWDDFWKAASRLLTGASLETVLHDSDASRSLSSNNVDNGNEPPMLLSNFAANSDIPLKPEARRPATSVSNYSNYVESDEEMARRLAAEWDNVGAAGMLALSKTAESHGYSDPTSLMEVDRQTGAMGDEEFAKYLQRQYDSENNVEATLSHGEVGSVAAISGSPFPVLSDTDETASIPVTPTQTMFAGDDEFEDTKPAAQMISSTESLAFEQYGDTFSLYHYNGLRGGILTHFRLTRLTAEEAVGASISLNRTGVVSSHGSSGTQDLEDVVRTKWPSCSINWLGKTPPCID
jgi:ubiquitin carboxyl-terminal hydrolase MINDY-3/4